MAGDRVDERPPPARVTWAERRERALEHCPCYPVETIVRRQDTSVAYPPCKICKFEEELRKCKG